MWAATERRHDEMNGVNGYFCFHHIPGVHDKAGQRRGKGYIPWGGLSTTYMHYVSVALDFARAVEKHITSYNKLILTRHAMLAMPSLCVQSGDWKHECGHWTWQ